MRLLADAVFPVFVEQYRTASLELHRWTGERIGDVELLKQCLDLQMSGVIFLGAQPLVSDLLRQRGQEWGLILAATSEVDPLEAARVLSNSMGALERIPGPGAYRVLSREIRPWEVPPR